MYVIVSALQVTGLCNVESHLPRVRALIGNKRIQVNSDMTDSMGPGKLVRHMQNPSYTYDEYLIYIGLGSSISSVICKNPSYSGPSYPSSPVYKDGKTVHHRYSSLCPLPYHFVSFMIIFFLKWQY